MERESFSSRLGFILISAGCAIGLGNVWRFPFVTGQYGGASFVLIYLCFLLLLGLPIMVAEFAVGRASRRSPAKSFDTLEPKGTKWHLFKYVTIAGNIILMMFYTTVSGWMLYFLYKMAVGDLSGLDAQGIKSVFGALLQDPATMAGNMAIIIMLCFGVCYMGVRNGVERITKVMMAFLIVLMVVLAANSMLLPGSEAGLKYYLYPDFDKIAEHGVREVIFAAMGQAFFTLSIGMGSLSIFGSYIGKEQKLTNEALWIMFLDTFVAIVAGLIIFPACFSFGIQPDAGPNLLFITLPNVFNAMNGGRIWGTLFFLFMLLCGGVLHLVDVDRDVGHEHRQHDKAHDAGELAENIRRNAVDGRCREEEGDGGFQRFGVYPAGAHRNRDGRDQCRIADDRADGVAVGDLAMAGQRGHRGDHDLRQRRADGDHRRADEQLRQVEAAGQ